MIEVINRRLTQDLEAHQGIIHWSYFFHKVLPLELHRYSNSHLLSNDREALLSTATRCSFLRSLGKAPFTSNVCDFSRQIEMPFNPRH